MKAVVIGALASLGILAWLVFDHLEPLLRVAGTIDLRYAAGALACAMASYLLIGLTLWEVLALLGNRLSIAEVFGIAFVSTSANYFISSLGVSGFALKAHLLRKRHVPYGATVTASVVSTAIMYAVLGVFILQGLVFLVLRLQGARFQVLEGVVGLLVLSMTAVPLGIFFFDRDLRSRASRQIFRWMNHASFYFSKKEIPKEDFEAFETQLEAGLSLIHASRGRLTLAIGYTALDWTLTMGVLYLCFRAVGVTLPVAHVSTGFAVGQAATLIPILPSGLGAMEGSMAAVFSRLGVDWDAAMVAVLLYRTAYYFVPGVVSVFLLWGLKMSEPTWIEETVSESLPEELRLQAEELERRKKAGRR